MQPDSRSLLRNLRLFEIKPMLRRVLGLRYQTARDFLPDIPEAEAYRMTDLALEARGQGPHPILVFGVLPRSGTNYLRDLVARHPDVFGDPGQLYEFPLLQAAGSSAAFMEDFVQRFPRNAEVLGRWDALALCAGAWLRTLQRDAGARHILLKSPHVENLSLAPYVFPDARILLCLRDGRDVVDSALRTFGKWSLRSKNFTQLAHSWRLGAEAILAFDEKGALACPNVLVVRYEALVATPEQEMRRVLDHLGLDPARYDFATADALPVRGSSRAKGEGADRWKGQEKAADFNPVARWKAWPPRRRARFRRIVGPVLIRAGYSDD